MSPEQPSGGTTRRGYSPRCGSLAQNAGVLLGLLAAFGANAVVATDKPLSEIAQSEVRRREALVRDAASRLAEADELMRSEKWEEAVAAYGQAYRSLPKAPMAQAARDHARAGYAAASCHWARQLMAEARYPEAVKAVDDVLAPDVDPENKQASELKKQFNDPDRFPRALTPAHIENVKKVESMLLLANSAIDIGDFDKATTAFQDVLRIDPYNKAARRGMERVEQKKSEFYDAARDHQRARSLAEVDRQWEDPVPPSAADLTALFGAAQQAQSGLRGGREQIIAQMRSTIVPKVDFSGATLEEVVEYLRVRSRDLDPKGRGVDFVINLPAESRNRLISLSLEQVPLEEVLRYVVQLGGATYRVEDRAVTIVSLSEQSAQMITKSYRVPPNFIQTAPVGDQAGGAAPADPFATQPAAPAGGLQIRRMGAREFLESRGITFKEGATASYNAYNNLLIVRNTSDNLAIVDMLVEQTAGASPKQVLISAKTIEVTETKLQELGFDWLLGPFNVPGSDRVFGSGGTAGNQLPDSFNLTEFPLSGAGQFPITAGLRSSGAILGKPSIDSLLIGNETPEITSRSPGVLALNGVFTDPQFQTVMRALNQQKGVDMVSVPSVVTKSGQKATIEVIREFPYPTEFEPPEIPQEIGGPILIGSLGPTEARSTIPITPTTPTAFEVRKVGSLLEVEPVISDDGRMVELTIAPTNTEFEGFIDYGSDIQNEILSSFDSPFDALGYHVISGGFYTVDNPILQPVFRTDKLSTGVVVWDGSTIVLGGVLSEKRTDIDDKVPIVGDIPVIGRLWQSKVKQVERLAVLYFVTVKVIDPSGQSLRPPAAPETAAR